jgi:ParB/RepB/Spo0J family partition protein
VQRDEVANLYLSQIVDPRVLLRPVNRKSVEWAEMLDSIEKNGLWNSICVRPTAEADKFEVIDGLWRMSCHRELKREPIPAIIKHGLSDIDVLAAQITANALRPETTAIEYAKQLKRIQQGIPGCTVAELAAAVKKNPHWIGQQLGLLELDAKTQRIVDRGEIPAQSAYMLAKVPSRFRGDLVKQAQAMPVGQFTALAACVIKQFMERVRDGKLDKQFNDLPFEPIAYLRPLKEVLAEIKKRESAPTAIVTAKAKTALEGFILGLQWAAHLDRKSVEEQRKAAQLKTRISLKRLYQERGKDEDLDT